MALTSSQKARVRIYLGFDRGYDLHPALESRLTTGALDGDEETLVGDTLTLLGQIDAKLMSAALTNLDASRVEDITLLGPEQLAELRRQGRMLIQRLSILFAVDPQRDYFDTSGAGGMGGLIALG